ncbi:MAG: uncharacterized protein QOD30_1973, partial [Actinomycetota bacterium]|nr:uncharacterized protein [Actinomycetota bacterium]
MDDDDIGLPIKLGPCSNGEFVPEPPTDLVREVARRARVECEENARRTGMSRRDFLLSICGAATTLSVLAACSKEKSKGATTGGTFTVPKEATTESSAAREAIGGDGFVMDVQTHFLEYDETNATQTYWGEIFPQSRCGEADSRDCFSTGQFLDLLLAGSDTSVGVLSGVPIVGKDAPLSSEHMRSAIDAADRLCGEGRLVMQGHVAPNNRAIETSVDAMADAVKRWPIKAWKAYTHASGPGWYLDGSDGSDIGPRFIRTAVELGVPVIAVHKGFSSGSRFAAPVDVGPAAKDHPDVTFTI